MCHVPLSLFDVSHDVSCHIMCHVPLSLFDVSHDVSCHIMCHVPLSLFDVSHDVSCHIMCHVPLSLFVFMIALCSRCQAPTLYCSDPAIVCANILALLRQCTTLSF